MHTAWFRNAGLSLATQAGTSDGMTLLALSSPMYQDFGGNALDWGKREMLKLIRVIARIVLILTSTGAANQVRVHYGLRLDEVDSDGSLRAAGDMPSVLVQSDDSRREDWLWRGVTAATVPAAAGSLVMVQGDGGAPCINLDTKCNRDFPQRLGLVFHLRLVQVGTTATSPDCVVSGDIDFQLLMGRRGSYG